MNEFNSIIKYTFHEFMAVCKYIYMYKYIHFFNQIVTQQMGRTPLHLAAMWGNAEVINALLKAGFKADEKDKVNMF